MGSHVRDWVPSLVRTTTLNPAFVQIIGGSVELDKCAVADMVRDNSAWVTGTTGNFDCSYSSLSGSINRRVPATATAWPV